MNILIRTDVTTLPDEQKQNQQPLGQEWNGFGKQVPWQRLTLRFTSWDGASWDLTDAFSPVYALQGLSGFGMADPDHWWDESPLVDSASWNGLRYPRKERFIPIRIEGPTPDDFMANHAAFLRACDPRKESTLSMITPDGDTRSVQVRYQSGINGESQLDPLMVRRVIYPVTWTTDPHWFGPDQSIPFVYDSPVNLFPGPPFTLNASRSLLSATTTNPGDFDTHPIWRVEGPYTSFSVGVGTDLVSVTLTRTAGQWVEIDTHRSRLTVKDESGTDRRSAVTARKFAAIPAGTDVPVVTTLVGAGAGSKVTLTYTPLYRSPW